ncbi:Lrp/AsnC family transcriptional regulator [Saccharopolyspora phatthalungensis]|uniref:DNA-binding Lrp family transcriptional regulator n=1 Tax=Saccharopolyspora phatthalungensis TaxID=664693 RepID=A0A840Q266_9PSEU|nr:Lrp/AsnC family transcriptional regulator [Saccharopolyspora phatthalungensis]MBB5153661.1 DNA-binding Lrp family transcriptional regulator [Saccharopolyspora phatthalungensis]
MSLAREPAPKDVSLDELDEQILWELSRDARIPNNTLAERLHVAPSTTLKRLRRLQQKRVYQSAHAQVHYPSLGLPIQAIVFVRMRVQARHSIRSYAQRAIMEPQVLNIFFLGGADDFLVHVAATSTEQLRDFVAVHLSADPAVVSTQTHIVFEHLIGNQHMGHVAGYEEMRRDIDGDAFDR